MPTLALAALLLLTSGPRAADAAEICATGVAGTATSCEAAWGLAQDLARRRSDRTLAADPARDRARRLDNSGWTQGSDTAAPFAISGDDDKVHFNTSLTQWGSALTAADLENLKQGQVSAGSDTALPKSPNSRAPKLDVWAQGRHERFSEPGVKHGDALTTYVGADYRWDRNLLVGGMIQLDDSHQSILAAPDASTGQGYMAGPYLAYRLTPHVMLDAKAAWGMAHDSAMAGSDSVSFATDRMLTEARLTGNWSWNSWRFSQNGALTYLDEAAPGSIALSDVTRFSFGPEVKHHIDAGNGASVEPFAFFRSSLNVAESEWNARLGKNTVGGGIELAKPDRYNIRAAADFTEDMGGGEAASGKVQVSLPSSLFGF